MKNTEKINSGLFKARFWGEKMALLCLVNDPFY